MKETVAYCDLDEKDARRPGVAVLTVTIDGTSHVVDVCQVHLTLLSRLPSTTAARGRGRRAVKRAPAKRAAAKKAVPAANNVAAPAAAPAKAAKRAPAKAATRRTRATRGAAAGRTPGSRRDQQQRVAAAREWARAQGRAIAGKGRLPAGLLEEFDAATS